MIEKKQHYYLVTELLRVYLFKQVRNYYEL